jgi:hypothetical protein
MIVEFYEEMPYIDDVFVNMIPNISYKKVIDWRPDDAPLPYTVDKNFKPPNPRERERVVLEKFLTLKNPIVIHPYSLGGTERALREKYMRSPKEDWWLKLFDDIVSAGGTPVVMGGEREKIDWGTDSIVRAYTGNDDFLYNVPLILNSKGFIGIMSWPYLISHYSNKVDTCLIVLCHQFWIQRHLAQDTSKLSIFKEIPDNKDIINSISVLKNEKDNLSTRV